MALPELIADSTTPGTVTAVGTLAKAATAGATEFETTAAAPAALQGAGQTRVIFDSEIVVFDTSTLNTTKWKVVERAAEGSTAAEHAIGVSGYNFLTKQSLLNATNGLLFNALPGSPYDGQVIHYQTTAMGELGVIWQLRYRTAASTSKWECIGGSPIYFQTSESLAPKGAGEELETAVKVTLPLAGTYTFDAAARYVANIPGGQNLFKIWLGKNGAKFEPPGAELAAWRTATVNEGTPIQGKATAEVSAADKIGIRVQSELAKEWKAFGFRLYATPIRVG